MAEREKFDSVLGSVKMQCGVVENVNLKNCAYKTMGAALLLWHKSIMFYAFNDLFNALVVGIKTKN